MNPKLLLTAFEPSGDEHASPVIARLKQLRPDLDIHAMGGPLMAKAGANLLLDSTNNATMLAGSLSKIAEHRRWVNQVRNWLREHPIAALIPVDSPAANWAMCKAVRQTQPSAKVLHLVAPQLWAWAPWRIKKMKRLSDHVMCLLPFEPDWFAQHDMPGTFVGHPVLSPRPTPESFAPLASAPAGSPRLLLLPGSRMGEIKANWPAMQEAYRMLKQRYPNLSAVVSMRDRAGMDRLMSLDPSKQEGLSYRQGETDSAIGWADLVLAVSGTVTLHVAAQRKPMVVIYRVNRLSWNLVGRWIIQARTFTLPNVLGERGGLGRVVCELVPHFGQVQPIVRELQKLLDDPATRHRQMNQLIRLTDLFGDRDYADTAARLILREIGLSTA